MSETRPNSFPFLHLARLLCLPYADVLLMADWFAGRRDEPTREAFERVAESDARNQQAIFQIYCCERDRRAAVST